MMKKWLICSMLILSVSVAATAGLDSPPLENTSFETGTGAWYKTHMMEVTPLETAWYFPTVPEISETHVPPVDGEYWGAIGAGNGIYQPIGAYSGDEAITVRLTIADLYTDPSPGPLTISIYVGGQEYDDNGGLIPGSPETDNGLDDIEGAVLVGTQIFTLDGEITREIKATFNVTGAQLGDLIWLELRNVSEDRSTKTGVDAVEVFEATAPLNPSPAIGETNVLTNAVLTWDASQAAGVTGYGVYMDKPGDPSLFLAATVSAAGPLEYNPSGDFELDFNQFRKWYVQAEPSLLLTDPNTPIIEFSTLDATYPGILAHPENWYGGIGDDCVLSVSAVNPVTLDSTGLEYQWSKDGSDISGATGDTLELLSVQVADEGLYKCAVTITSTSESLDSDDARVRTRRLMGHWKLDEVSGGDPNVIPDSIQDTYPAAAAYDGVISGAAASYAAGVNGTASGAFDFAVDTNATIEIEGSETYLSEDNTDGFTVSAWINTPHGVTYDMDGIVYSFSGMDAYEPGFALGTFTDKNNSLERPGPWDNAEGRFYTRRTMDGLAHESSIRECVVIGGPFYGIDVANGAPGNHNGWHLLTMTHDNATEITTLYINSIHQQVISAAGEIKNHFQQLTDNQPAGISPLKFGGNRGDDADLFYNGQLDDVRFWNYPLDEVAVAELYFEQTGLPICLNSDMLPADVSGDCLVNLDDLAIIAGAWLDCQRNPVSSCF